MAYFIFIRKKLNNALQDKGFGADTMCASNGGRNTSDPLFVKIYNINLYFIAANWDFPSIGFLPPPLLNFCTPFPFCSCRPRPPSLNVWQAFSIFWSFMKRFWCDLKQKSIHNLVHHLFPDLNFDKNDRVVIKEVMTTALKYHHYSIINIIKMPFKSSKDVWHQDIEYF